MSNEQQAPLFYYMKTSDGHDVRHSSWISEAHKRDGWLPLYSAPPLRDLSDEEIRLALYEADPELDFKVVISDDDMTWLRGIANAIIKAARDKV